MNWVERHEQKRLARLERARQKGREQLSRWLDPTDEGLLDVLVPIHHLLSEPLVRALPRYLMADEVVELAGIGGTRKHWGLVVLTNERLLAVKAEGGVTGSQEVALRDVSAADWEGTEHVGQIRLRTPALDYKASINPGTVGEAMITTIRHARL